MNQQDKNLKTRAVKTGVPIFHKKEGNAQGGRGSLRQLLPKAVPQANHPPPAPTAYIRNKGGGPAPRGIASGGAGGNAHAHHSQPPPQSLSKRLPPPQTPVLGPLKPNTPLPERACRVLRGKTVPPNLYEVVTVELDLEKDEPIGFSLKGEVICGVAMASVGQGKLQVGDVLLTVNGIPMTDSGTENKIILTNLVKLPRKKCKFDVLRFKCKAPVQTARLEGYLMAPGYDYSCVLLYLVKGINVGLELRSIEEKVFVDRVGDNGSASMSLSMGDSIIECEGKFVTTAEQVNHILVSAISERGAAIMTVESPTTDLTKNTVRYKLLAARQPPENLDLPLDLDAIQHAKMAAAEWQKHKTIEPKPILKEKKGKSPFSKSLHFREETKVYGIPTDGHFNLLVKVPPAKIALPDGDKKVDEIEE